MSGKDFIMMIIAFAVGLVLVTVIFSGKPQEQSGKDDVVTPAPAGRIDVPDAQLVGLSGGYFIYRSAEERFFLCKMENDRLEVVDVFKLTHKPPTYFAGILRGASHGWSFESLSRAKEAVLEAKQKQFQKAVEAEDWSKAQELAAQIAAVGGVEFLKKWLDPKRKWWGRRAAALSLAERGYVETVPTLVEMLLEGREFREKSANLLVKLTGKDFFEGSKSRSQGKAIEAYRKWYEQERKKDR